MEPTLFVELVDRTDAATPKTLHQMPVSVRVDTDQAFEATIRGRGGYRVVGGDVDGGHQLDVGDIVVAYDWDEPEHAWLAEVVEAVGFPAERFYTLVTLAPTTRARWAYRSSDRRWDAWRADTDA